MSTRSGADLLQYNLITACFKYIWRADRTSQNCVQRKNANIFKSHSVGPQKFPFIIISNFVYSLYSRENRCRNIFDIWEQHGNTSSSFVFSWKERITSAAAGTVLLSTIFTFVKFQNSWIIFNWQIDKVWLVKSNTLTLLEISSVQCSLYNVWFRILWLKYF